MAPELREVRINGQRMLYSPAASEAGILFLFHGNGGSPSIWVDRTEHVIATLAAMERGLLVIALKSVGMGWDKRCCDGDDRCCDEGVCCTDEVADIGNVQDAIAHMVGEGLVAEGAPVYALGYSNGGGFTGRLTQGVNLVAAATVNSGSSSGIIRETDDVPPMFFQGAAQDPTVDPERPRRNHASFVERGLRTELRINAPAPLTPGRLSRIEGISCELSINLYEGLQRAGLIGEDGSLSSTPSAIIERMEATAAWRENGLDAHSRDITLQFRELDAQHAFSSEWIDDIMDFLLEGGR
jgi:dienelactone hydrolase